MKQRHDAKPASKHRRHLDKLSIAIFAAFLLTIALLLLGVFHDGGH